jgi:hypothetical protein
MGAGTIGGHDRELKRLERQRQKIERRRERERERREGKPPGQQQQRRPADRQPERQQCL